MNDDAASMPSVMPSIVKAMQSRSLDAMGDEMIQKEILEEEMAAAITSRRLPVPDAVQKRVMVPVILGRGASVRDDCFFA